MFLGAAALLAALSALPAPWAGWARDGCERANCYCEPLTGRFVEQPWAAYSNLGFIAAGLWMLAAPRAGGNLLCARPAYAGMFAATALGTGFGSFFYHASLTRLGEWLDLVGLYLFTSSLLVYGLARLTGEARPARWLALYAGLNLAGGLQMLWAREWQQVVFGALAAGALGVEVCVLIRRRPRVRWLFLGAALAGFIIGAALWTAPCAAGWPFPPHAGWHLLAAATQVWLFAYYRSERPGPAGPPSLSGTTRPESA